MTAQPSVAEIALYVGGSLVGPPDRIITGVSTPEEADTGDLVFVDSPRQLGSAITAGAVLTPVAIDPRGIPRETPLIRVDDPAEAMARVIEWLFPVRRTFEGVAAHASIAPSARLGAEVGIGPFVHVGENVSIGDRTEIHPMTTIGDGTQIGADCVIYSGVHIYPGMVIGDRVVLHSGVVIGADGFGYAREPLPSAEATPEEPQRHRKIRHIGSVVIEDDVEIGANTTIDRATFTVTRIGRGTKIDNLVTIGHNARVGRHCIIIGQAGISGSTELGDYVTVAGQAGLAGHVRIGSHVVIGAQSGVTKDIAPGQVVLGSPAVEAKRAKKALTLIDSLPDFKRRLAAHERRIAELERLASDA